MGTNPLPNFVVVAFFAKYCTSLRKIWIVHSDENALKGQHSTLGLAENLTQILQNRGHVLEFSFISLSDIGSARQIGREISDNLIAKLTKQNKIHLNYTGGTKTMGNHVYRTLERAEEIEGCVSFSYLDARTFSIVDDDSGQRLNAKDLRQEITLSLEELFFLHGFKRKNEDNETDFPEATRQFGLLLTQGSLWDGYYSENGGYQRRLFETTKGALAEKVSEIKEIENLRNYQPNPSFLQVIQAMPEDFRLFDSSAQFVGRNLTNKRFKNALKFLDGGWFEDYIFLGIAERLQRKPKENIWKNWQIDKQGWRNDNNFELDVILLNGYQLVGISCTTEKDRRICKSKGFEIILRTRQIGGEEAKAILITSLEPVRASQLQSELELDTGGSSNILILGKDAWKEQSFCSKIQEFLK
jgi:hypothetical protein